MLWGAWYCAGPYNDNRHDLLTCGLPATDRTGLAMNASVIWPAFLEYLVFIGLAGSVLPNQVNLITVKLSLTGGWVGLAAVDLPHRWLDQLRPVHDASSQFLCFVSAWQILNRNPRRPGTH